MSSLLQTESETVVGPYPLAPRVVTVEVLTERTVRVTFEGGETRDVSPALDKGIFQALREPGRFAEVSVVEGGGGIEWSSGADLSANRLYFGPGMGWGAPS